MGHTWKAQIIRGDGSSLTFADGDDVAVTAGLRLLSEPTVALERNVPRKAVLELPTSPTAGRNPRSSSFSAWSSGPAGAIARGMHVRVWHTDSASGTEVQTFQGRIRRIDRDDNRVVLTAYDDLMELAELREPATFFNSARDHVGDNTFAAPPDIPITINSDGQITATLPDFNIVQPLMRLAIAEPQDFYTGAMDGERSTATGSFQYGHVVTIRVGHTDFYRIRLRYRSTAPVSANAVVMNTTWNGYYHVPATTLKSLSLTLPNTNGEFIEYETPPIVEPLLKGYVYAFGFTLASMSTAIEPALSASGQIPESWGEYYRKSDGTWQLITAPYEPIMMNLQFLVEREIPSDRYRLTGKDLVIAQGDTTIKRSDLARYDRHLRVSYFYGNLAPEEIMERLVQHAGMSAARAGTLSRGLVNIGYYHTSTRPYLDCLRELADIWEPTHGHQWTVSMDMAADLSSKTVRIGRRRRPWLESIDSHTFAEGPFAAGTKRIRDSQLRETFEAKIATVRVLGQAFDGSPVSAQVDDRLWGADSLIAQTGAELMEHVLDRAVTTSDQASRVAEARVREQHQNHLEGTLQLSGRWPSLWDQDPASNGCGGSRLFGITSERDGLSSAKALARRIEIGGGRTLVDLDNVRQPDRSMIRRSMDKTLSAEGFSVASMPNVVYIHARVESFTPKIMSDGITLLQLRRSDGVLYGNENATTVVVRSDDNCAPDARGYAHFAVYIPPFTLYGPTSYNRSTYSVWPFTEVVAYTSDNTYVTASIRPQWIWSHQAVLVDLYGRRPA